MGTDDISKEDLFLILKEVRDLLKPDDPRKTNGISRTALAIHTKMADQRKDCFKEFDRRIAELQKLLCLKISTLQNEIEELKTMIEDWETKIFAVKEDTERTATGKISSLETTLNLIKNELLGDHPRGIKGIKDHAHDSKRWIEMEEARRKEEKEQSRYSVRLVFSIITLIAMLGFSTAGTIIALIQLGRIASG